MIILYNMNPPTCQSNGFCSMSLSHPPLISKSLSFIPHRIFQVSGTHTIDRLSLKFFSVPLLDNAPICLVGCIIQKRYLHRNSIQVAANVLYSHMHMIEREMRTYDSLIHNGFFVWATPFIEPEKGWCRLVLFLELSMRRKPRQMTTKKEQEQQESITCYLPT